MKNISSSFFSRTNYKTECTRVFLCPGHQDMFCILLSLLVLSHYVIRICCLCFCCFQMPRRDQPRDSRWTGSSITHLCCSARRTTCCTSEPGRRCLLSASRTSARLRCEGMSVRRDARISYSFRVLAWAETRLACVSRDLIFDSLVSSHQLTWGTPAGKREECSFKGKNLEVRASENHFTNPKRTKCCSLPPTLHTVQPLV